MTSEPSPEQMQRFVHRYEHLRRRKNLDALPEGEYVQECWGVLEGPPPPQWALDLAQRGESGSLWCPILTPSLRAET